MPTPKKHLKIAMLGHKRIPSREGGVEIVVEELSVRMASKGYDVTCFNRKGHHVSGTEFDSEKFDEYRGVKIKEVFTINKGGLAAMSSSFFASIKAAFGDFAVVHFHAEGPCAMMWLPKLFGKRCIATIHGLDHQRAKWGRFARWYIRFGEKCAVKFADEIIVLSKNTQDYFRDTYGRETVFIPNGVNKTEKLAAKQITAKYALQKDSYILYLGRLVPEKGIIYLVKAYKELRTDKKLVIAGGSSDAGDFEKQLKNLTFGDDKIVYTGFVQGDMLRELYSNAYIYVLPSDLEGMPLSLLEAMSYGNCCLTSDIPECASVIDRFGCTFRKSDIEELKTKLQDLCDNPSVVEHYKNKSADYICSKYNWDEVAFKTLMLYGFIGISDYSVPMEEKEYESVTG